MPISSECRRVLRTFLATLLLGCMLPAIAQTPGFHDFAMDPAKHRVALHLRDAEGRILGDFTALERHLADRGERLLFAMNAGIFMVDRRPLGLYIENGTVQRPLIEATSGYGNFYMQPNGVFAVTAAGPAVVPTAAWHAFARTATIQFATQSGPMVLIDGEINPLFNKDSRSRLVRNAVCTGPEKRLWLTISLGPVNFHELAEHLRTLGCTQGLYMDGAISGAYSAQTRLDRGTTMFGPLLAVTAATPD